VTTRNIKNCFSCFTYKEHGIIQMRSNHLHFVLGASFCIWATIIFAIIMVLSEKLCSICTPEVPVEWIYCFTPLQNIGETTQWQKEKGGKDNDLQNSTQKINGPH
jgi:hypothetical protein